MTELKVARGKPFSAGLVFVDGKYIEPPYVVERYGNVIRVNKIQVTNPVIDWNEFLKTQPGAKVEKPKPAVEAKPEKSKAPPAPAVTDYSEAELAALFEDAPAASAPEPAKPAAVPPPAPAKPEVEFDGPFEMNERAQALVKRLNAQRTEIDLALRRGGFYCFGSRYSQVSGNVSETDHILREVPVLMKRYADADAFAAAMRKAGFVYLPPKCVEELFANRVDYLKLERRWKKILEEKQLQKLSE